MINAQHFFQNGRLYEMIAPLKQSIKEYIFPLNVTEENFREGWVALVKYSTISINERVALEQTKHNDLELSIELDFTNRLKEQLISWISVRLHNQALCEQVKFQFLPDSWVLLYI